MFYDPKAPVQPNQYAGEFQGLLSLLQERNIWRVLEIGAFEGGTLYQWMKLIGPGGFVCAIDLPGAAWGISKTAHPKKWQHWAESLGVTFQLLSKDSHDPASRRWASKRGPFDLIFIDGDHSYKGVVQDFEDYSSMAAEGGVVALHDILYHPSDPSIEVYRLWATLKDRSKTMELTSFSNQAEKGIGVCFF